MAIAAWLSIRRLKAAPRILVNVFFMSSSLLMELLRGDWFDVRNFRIEAIQSLNESHERLFFVAAQTQRDHKRIEVGIFSATSIIKINQRLEGLLRTVVKVWGAAGRVADCGRLESSHVARIFGYGVSPDVGILGILGWNTQVVKSAVTEIGAPMACSAVSFAVEDFETLLLQPG